jgi:phosphoglycolate phosphatase
LNRYSGYLFDLDGTLVDTAPDINLALNHALTTSGFDPVNEALTRHWVGHGARALVREAIADQDLPETLEEHLVTVFIDHYEQHIADASLPYPGVVETLERLGADGAKLAVVTNKMTRLSVPLLDALNLSRFFGAVICGDTAERPKPSADPALLACERLAVEPVDALFVGDSETDVSCARAAGCPIVVVRDGYNHGIPAEALAADRVIDSFLDLV